MWFCRRNQGVAVLSSPPPLSLCAFVKPESLYCLRDLPSFFQFEVLLTVLISLNSKGRPLRSFRHAVFCTIKGHSCSERFLSEWKEFPRNDRWLSESRSPALKTPEQKRKYFAKPTPVMPYFLPAISSPPMSSSSTTARNEPPV